MPTARPGGGGYGDTFGGWDDNGGWGNARPGNFNQRRHPPVPRRGSPLQPGPRGAAARAARSRAWDTRNLDEILKRLQGPRRRPRHPRRAGAGAAAGGGERRAAPLRVRPASTSSMAKPRDVLLVGQRRRAGRVQEPRRGATSTGAWPSSSEDSPGDDAAPVAARDGTGAAGRRRPPRRSRGAAATTGACAASRRGCPTSDANFDGGFNFCRAIRNSWGRWREPGGQGWSTYYPDADINFSIGFAELTKTRVSRQPSGVPNHWGGALLPTVAYPLPVRARGRTSARWSWRDDEVLGPARLPVEGRLPVGRRLLGPRGPGTVFEGEIARVLPPAQLPDQVTSDPEHAIYRMYVPRCRQSRRFRRSSSGGGSGGGDVVGARRERAPRCTCAASPTPKGELMVLATHNTDIQDAWDARAKIRKDLLRLLAQRLRDGAEHPAVRDEPLTDASLPDPRSRSSVLRHPTAGAGGERPPAGHGISTDRHHVPLLGAQARRPRGHDVRSGQSRHAEHGHRRRAAAAEAGPRRHELPVDHELSLRQDPGAAAARGRCPRQAGVRRGVRDAERAAGQGAVPGSRLRVPGRRRAAHRRPARAPERSRHGDWRHLAGEGRHAPQQPEPDAAARPRPVALSRPREPAARLRRVDAARCPGRAVAGSLHHDADVARLSLAVRVLRHPDLQRGQVAGADSCPRHCRVRAAAEGRLRLGLLRG